MRVSTENNGSAANVSVALVAQPSSQKPTFTSGCAKGDGTAGCTVSSVSDKQAADLQAQIPVASGATSVTSVKLTATASIVTSVKWTPLSAAETVAVTAAASASPAGSSAGSSARRRLGGDDAAARAHPNLNGVELADRRRNASSLSRDQPVRHANSSPGFQPGGQAECRAGL